MRKLNKKIINQLLLLRYSLKLYLILGIFLFPYTAIASPITSEKIIDLTNIERMKQGVNKLTQNSKLEEAATNKGVEIMKRQSFQHNFADKRFSSWVKDVGYEYSIVGENLAIDFNTAEGVMNALVESPSHYSNIVNKKFEDTGVAIIKDNFEGSESILVVQIFGKLKNPPTKLPSQKINNLEIKDTIGLITLDNSKDKFDLPALNIEIKNDFSENEQNNAIYLNFLTIISSSILLFFLLYNFIKIFTSQVALANKQSYAK